MAGWLQLITNFDPPLYILSMKYNEWELKMNQDKTYIWQWYNIILNQFLSFYQFHLQNSTLLADIELIIIFYWRDSGCNFKCNFHQINDEKDIIVFLAWNTSNSHNFLRYFWRMRKLHNYIFRETTMENISQRNYGYLLHFYSDSLNEVLVDGCKVSTIGVFYS